MQSSGAGLTHRENAVLVRMKGLVTVTGLGGVKCQHAETRDGTPEREGVKPLQAAGKLKQRLGTGRTTNAERLLGAWE